MGCTSSKEEVIDSYVIDPVATNTHLSSNRQSRVRRLSQTVFEAENYTAEEPVTISVPVPVPVGGAPVPTRKRRERRSSYIQFDTDPRNVVAAVAHACVAGAESGRNKRNQDALMVHMDDTACVFAVFDGHGHHGHHCSNFLKTAFPSVLKVNLLSDVSTGDMVCKSLLDAEKSMLDATIDCTLSGTTATVAMLQATRLMVAWVGDSPCFLISRSDDNWSCKDLAPAHDFDKPGERERVLAKGGRVMRFEDDGDFVGPLRVFLADRPMPGLNMSRSLADTLAHKIGVSSEPEITVTDLDETNKFLVVASDGLLEFMTMEEVMEMLKQNDDIQEVCDVAVSIARQRWLDNESGVSDDISTIIVKLKPDTSSLLSAV